MPFPSLKGSIEMQRSEINKKEYFSRSFLTLAENPQFLISSYVDLPKDP